MHFDTMTMDQVRIFKLSNPCSARTASCLSCSIVVAGSLFEHQAVSLNLRLMDGFQVSLQLIRHTIATNGFQITLQASDCDAIFVVYRHDHKRPLSSLTHFNAIYNLQHTLPLIFWALLSVFLAYLYQLPTNQAFRSTVPYPQAICSLRPHFPSPLHMQ